MNAIVVINNIYKAYFDLSYYVIDWFTLIHIPAMFLSSLILAMLAFNSIVDSRKLFVLLSICAIFSCGFSMISFTFTYLYAFVFLGQFIIGFGAETSSAIISSLATNWFPEDQIAFALSFKLLVYH